MKIVDNYTGYLVVGASESTFPFEDKEDGKVKCEYAIIEVDDELVNIIRDIINISNMISSKPILIGFYFDKDLITFLGDNPNLSKCTSISESIAEIPYGNILNVELEDDEFDCKSDYRSGSIKEYGKDHVILDFEKSGCYYISFRPEDRNIAFKYAIGEDFELVTYSINIDYLMGLLRNGNSKLQD